MASPEYQISTLLNKIENMYNGLRQDIKNVYKMMKNRSINLGFAKQKIDDMKLEVVNSISCMFSDIESNPNLTESNKNHYFQMVKNRSNILQNPINLQIQQCFINVGMKISVQLIDVPRVKKTVMEPIKVNSFANPNLKATTNAFAPFVKPAYEESLRRTSIELESTVQKLTDEKMSLLKSVESLRREKEALQFEKNKLVTDKYTLTYNIQRMNDEKNKILFEIEQMKEEINELENEKNMLIQSIYTLSYQNSQLKNDQIKYNSQITQLEEELEPLMERNQELRNEYDRLVKRNEDAVKPLKELKAMLTSVARNVLRKLDDGPPEAKIELNDIVQGDNDSTDDEDEENGDLLCAMYMNDMDTDGLV